MSEVTVADNPGDDGHLRPRALLSQGTKATQPMSNTELDPASYVCADGGGPGSVCDGSVPVEIITARDVPLGGPRAMNVRRTLPQRLRSTIGAWCFADHYGPDDVAATGGMDVAPHPHTGLQTASWLFLVVRRHRRTPGLRWHGG